jgi:hypothetical protein
LKNFTTCFNISITTNHISDETGFSAIGDTAYLSSNLSCEENKRYIYTTANTTNITCENALNEKINTTFSLPDYKKISRNVIDENATSVIEDKRSSHLATSSFNPLYLLIILPIVLIASLIACCYIFLIRKIKFKLEIQWKVDDMQEMLNIREDQNIYERIYNDGWEKISRKDYLKYVKLAFEPSCTHFDDQFSDFPTGYLKDHTESLKKENIPKNQDQSILPYDVNRVKLNNKKERRSTDYINASYVQISDNEKEYIVTQNPLKNTIDDFWHMIWQENVNHIVLISSPNEEFVYYWPKLKNDVVRFDDIRVSIKEICYNKFYIHRKLQVQRKGKSRQIDQLHYNTWEIDNDLNLTSRTCKEFMNHLLKIPHHVAPVVVHSK